MTARWKACYEAGNTLDELSKSSGVNANTIRDYLLRAGVTMRPQKRRP